ncbi:MAG TPA: hypothetical protein VN706_17800 [Gemmatimonadaceae bacterium]|nr:hypothetical protein [Gemmatimonadaceae bacterium]
MRKLAGTLNVMPSASRSFSRSSRTRANLQHAVTRLITGVVAVASLVFAAQTLDRPRADASLDTLHSVSPPAPSSLLRSVPSSRIALESRSPARSATGLGAALPVFARATFASTVASSAAAGASGAASASIIGRGYDATAPPR